MIKEDISVDYDELTREYCYKYLFHGIVKREAWPECGFGEYELAIAQYERHIDKKVPAQKIKENIKSDKRLKHLFEDNPVQGEDEQEDVKGEAPPIDFTLPAVNLDNSLFASVRAQFVAFAKELSPESYDWFLEAAFWWTCSAIAMRRIAIDFREPVYTNLYIALCAKSSVWKKSTGLRPVRRILKGLSLGHLLHEGSETPEAFISQAAGKTIPRDWEDANEDEKEKTRRELATAGLGGLFIDELGQYLMGTRSITGTMALWRRIILEWNECREDWAKKTKGDGWEIVEKTYLSMFGCIVPDNLNGKDMEAIQKDGTIARFLAITPPHGTGAGVSSFELGYLSTPPELLKAFSEWHQRLRPPVTDVSNENEGDEKKKAKYVKEWVQPLQETMISVTSDAYQVWHEFRKAIRKYTLENNLPSIFAAYYDRLGIDFIKMAAIAASFEGKYSIDLTHLAMAYDFIEEARKGVHRLMLQAGGIHEDQDYEERKAKMEKEILSEIKEYFKSGKKEDFSIPILLNRRPKLEKISITTLTQVIEDLVKSQFLAKETKEHPANKKKTTVYKLNI